MNKNEQKKFISKKMKELSNLLNKWNPIGVSVPEDEYDCFTGPILSLLQRNKSKRELIDFLNTHLKQHIGIDPEPLKPDEFAEKIMQWWKAE